MLCRTSPSRVEFLELVVHPGGPDGGVFPKYENFEISGGNVTYTYDLPISPTDDFCDEDIEVYNRCPDGVSALGRLLTERDELSKSLRIISEIITVLESGCKYDTIARDDEGEEDEPE